MRGIQAYSIEGTHPFPRGDTKKIAKIQSKIFFSKNNEPVSTRLGAKHPWGKGIQVCSDEWSRYFPILLYNNKAPKIHVQFKFVQMKGPILLKLKER